jgi:hypothetical protein
MATKKTVPPKADAQELVTGYRPAKGTTLGEIIDELGRRYLKRKDADAAAEKLKKQEDVVREYLLALAHDQDINGARGSIASVAVSTADVPTVEDWDAFFAFCKKKGNDDLLQRSVSSPAWRERIKDKKAVPGTGTFQRTTLRLNMLKGGAE